MAYKGRSVSLHIGHLLEHTYRLVELDLPVSVSTKHLLHLSFLGALEDLLLAQGLVAERI